MKRKGFLALISTLLLGGLTSCGPKVGPIEYSDKLASSSQEGVILHAFNWSFNTIKENLPAIKEAGYTSVQTSPVQQPKGGGANWWSLYQPVSFSIATSSSLGNKEDLKEIVTTTAEIHSEAVTVTAKAMRRNEATSSAHSADCSFWGFCSASYSLMNSRYSL